jgi:hypothetical protein
VRGTKLRENLQLSLHRVLVRVRWQHGTNLGGREAFERASVGGQTIAVARTSPGEVDQHERAVAQTCGCSGERAAAQGHMHRQTRRVGEGTQIRGVRFIAG